MAPERRLIPLAPDDATSSSSSTTTVQCTSTVVGVIPPAIHALLTPPTSSNDDVIRVTGGRVDDQSSGLSYLRLRNGNVVAIWDHATQTINEELVVSEGGVCRLLSHPEHDNGDDGDDDCLLVTCLGPDLANVQRRRQLQYNNDANGALRRSTRRAGVPHPPYSTPRTPSTLPSSTPLRYVYIASPTTGVLCVYVIDNNTSNNSGGEQKQQQQCDASVRLKLKPNEVITTLTPIKSAVVGGTTSAQQQQFTTWILLTTSHGRLWKVYRTARPATLHAKRVHDGKIRDYDNDRGLSEGGDGSSGPMVVGGIVHKMYNYLTTPSKSIKPSVENDEELMADDTNDDKFDHKGGLLIVALLPLPPSVVMASDVVNRSPARGPPSTPAPNKQQRLLVSNNGSSGAASSTKVVTITSSLVIKQWNIATSITSADGDVLPHHDGRVVEGFTKCTTLITRKNDGTLDLSPLLSQTATTMDEVGEGGDGMMISNNEGYHNLEVLSRPVLSADGTSIIAIIRLSNNDNVSMTRVYVVRIGGFGNTTTTTTWGGAPCIIDAVWLDKFSGPSLSSSTLSTSAALACVGLTVSDDENEESVVGGGVVAYVGFGPSKSGKQNHPVTVSAIYFPRGVVNDNRQQQRQHPPPPRVKDLEINPTIVPAAVNDTLSLDPVTGGCIFLATTGLLCSTHVRFPPSLSDVALLSSSRVQGGERLTDLLRVPNEIVLTIKSHLQSSFRQYLIKLNEAGGGGSGGSLARMVIAPSVGTCPSRILTAAAVLASNDYACAMSSQSSSSSGSFSVSSFSPRSPATSSSPLNTLREKIRIHRDFITFLVHAGAYRRILTDGRVLLRDHGELLTTTRTLLIECQSFFTKADATATAAGGDGREEVSRMRRLVMSTLDGVSDDVTALPRRWAGLQHLATSSTPLRKDIHLLLTSTLICQGIGQALHYRYNESIPLYDIPSHDSSPSSSSCLPWTSSSTVLDVLVAQLRSIQQLGETILSTTMDYDVEKANLRRYVEDLSASTLSGYRDALQRAESDSSTDTEGLKSSYEEAKSLSVSLLRLFANDEGDDSVALQTSLEHSYFEGIVQICYDHRQSWMYQGPFSDKTADERYDLRSFMINTLPDSPYAHLHQSCDYQTGLSFCSFVLSWYANQGLFPDVFELGKNCQQELSRYIRSDNRLSHMAWIQHLRVGGHEQATTDLIGLTSPLLFGKESEEMSLWEMDHILSIAKLSNKLAVSKSVNLTAAQDQRTKLIDNALAIVDAQKILQEEDELGDEVALDENDVVRLAVEKIQSCNDIEKIKRFAICGLSVANAKSSDQVTAMASDASSIWHAVIQADIDKWQSVANEHNSAVGGIQEEELIHNVGGTAFVGVMGDFVHQTSGEEINNVGFGNDRVRCMVMDALGSNELERVLQLSADIVLASV